MKSAIRYIGLVIFVLGLSCMPFPVTNPKATTSLFPWLAMSGLLVEYGAWTMAIGAALFAVSFALREPMDNEFQKTGMNTVVSSGGFTVEAQFAEVAYDDATGHVEIYAEWGGTPTKVILYKRSLKGMPTSRVAEVLSNVTRALQYLGHGVEVSSDQ